MGRLGGHQLGLLITNDIGHTADCGRHNRDTSRHGLEQRNGSPLSSRTHGKHIERSIKSVGLRDRTMPTDSIGYAK